MDERKIVAYRARSHIGDEEMKTGLKTKVYARGFHFTSRDGIECMVGSIG